MSMRADATSGLVKMPSRRFYLGRQSAVQQLTQVLHEGSRFPHYYCNWGRKQPCRSVHTKLAELCSRPNFLRVQNLARQRLPHYQSSCFCSGGHYPLHSPGPLYEAIRDVAAGTKPLAPIWDLDPNPAGMHLYDTDPMTSCVVDVIITTVVTPLAEDIGVDMNTRNPSCFVCTAQDDVVGQIGVAVSGAPNGTAPVCPAEVAAPCSGRSVAPFVWAGVTNSVPLMFSSHALVPPCITIILPGCVALSTQTCVMLAVSACPAVPKVGSYPHILPASLTWGRWRWPPRCATLALEEPPLLTFPQNNAFRRWRQRCTLELQQKEKKKLRFGAEQELIQRGMALNSGARSTPAHNSVPERRWTAKSTCKNCNWKRKPSSFLRPSLTNPNF